MTPSGEMLLMPAEWKPHEACLITYPHNAGVFRSEVSKCDLARVEVRNVARAICKYGKENVWIFCNTQEEAHDLRSVIQIEDKSSETQENECKIFIEICKSDDSWCRDTGPTFVQSKESNTLVGLDWDFNAYGGPKEGCYWPCDLDRNVARNMISILSRNLSPALKIIHLKVDEIVLEGGSFHTDGEGTILTTEECLLNPNRNPNYSREQIESIILHKLGGTKVIWLPKGIAFDEDTNGHVDNIATFARPGEIVLSWTDDVEDANYPRFKSAEDVLLKELDARGRSFKVHKLHVPDPMYYTVEEVESLNSSAKTYINDSQACDRNAGERLAASYVNYYLANEAVILPQFGDKIYDNLAIQTMKKIFPCKNIFGVYSKEILLGGGNIHCITQQLPKLERIK